MCAFEAYYASRGFCSSGEKLVLLSEYKIWKDKSE